MKNVLGLVISERKLGNCELLLKEILSNVPAPCRRELIRLTELEIKPCKACYHCLKPGAMCSLNDDLNFVLQKIKEADALIIGVPVYFLGPHAYLKLLGDRMLGAGHYAEYTRGKPCLLVIPYGMPGWEGYTKSATLTLPRLLGMKIIDCWQVNAALPGESVINEANLAYAQDTGRTIFLKDEYPKETLECPQCGSDLFRFLKDGKIECPICLGTGELKQDNKLDFSSSTHNRFSKEELETHFGQWLVNMKGRFLNEKERLKAVQIPYKKIDFWVKPKS